MGLDARYGPKVKKVLRERFADSFRVYPTLIDARNASRAEREQTFVCLDGNVLFHRIPVDVRTFDAYVGILLSQLKQIVATAIVTVVLFDNPEHLTEAKLEEQARRDVRRKSKSVATSADMQPVELDDGATRVDIQQANPSVMVNNRLCQGRFFDEVAVTLLDRLQGQIDKWKASGFPGGDIVFDGIDPRGANRPKTCKREAVVIGSSDEACAVFARTTPTGEGDIKLAEMGRKMRAMAREEQGAYKDVRLTLSTTVDTDGLAIELIEEAKRDDQALPRGRARAAVTLLVTGWGLCGCDFIEGWGLRADVVLHSVGKLLEERPELLQHMRHAWSDNRADLVHTERPVRHMMALCADKLQVTPRIRKDCIESIRSPPDNAMLRSRWLAAYWNGVEHKQVTDFGFCGVPCDLRHEKG